MINFLFFAHKVVSGMRALRLKFLEGYRHLIPSKIGDNGGPEGVKIWLFSLFICIMYSFIYPIHSYFPILLVCDEC